MAESVGSVVTGLVGFGLPGGRHPTYWNADDGFTEDESLAAHNHWATRVPIDDRRRSLPNTTGVQRTDVAVAVEFADETLRESPASEIALAFSWTYRSNDSVHWLDRLVDSIFVRHFLLAA